MTDETVVPVEAPVEAAPAADVPVETPVEPVAPVAPVEATPSLADDFTEIGHDIEKLVKDAVAEASGLVSGS